MCQLLFPNTATEEQHQQNKSNTQHLDVGLKTATRFFRSSLKRRRCMAPVPPRTPSSAQAPLLNAERRLAVPSTALEPTLRYNRHRSVKGVVLNRPWMVTVSGLRQAELQAVHPQHTKRVSLPVRRAPQRALPAPKRSRSQQTGISPEGGRKFRHPQHFAVRRRQQPRK